MNIAAAHSYNAVPFMFTVAPSGKTKLDVLFETPMFCSTLLIVTGNVADDEAVENAVSIAGDAPTSVLSGFTRPTKCSNNGKVMNACSANASNTAMANNASGPVAPSPASAITAPTRPNTPIGANFIIHSVIFIMT